MEGRFVWNYSSMLIYTNTKSSWCFLSCVEEGEEGLISLSTLSVFFLVISSPFDHPQEFWKSSEWIILACFIALLWLRHLAQEEGYAGWEPIAVPKKSIIQTDVDSQDLVIE